uniref:Head Tail Connector Protein n=2 Tax=unclassified Caudoviricetes TaxID=2788787 RepID=A0A8S5QF58_9CAUD|nr:MAG TPA: Head Tail Connector Protein [Siphoviridae sp. ctMkg9]DAE17887.1 MAG TPA: Head Tail Connector Protein [Siphoviridae sp. ctRBF36]
MTNYTNYDFYKNTYKGDMPETDFNKVIVRASYEVQKNIFNRDIKGYEDEVQMATCSVADILLKVEQLENKKDTILSNNNLKSESVGDYSRTFDTLGIDNVDVEISNQKNKIVEEIRLYLLHTGLLYRGV